MQEKSDAQHLSVFINCDLAEAYDFLSVPANFSKWASGLGSLREVTNGWIAETPDGPMKVCFSDRNAFGVLDHWVFPAPDVTLYIPMRLVRNGAGCELILTLFRVAGMSDDKFAADAEWVLRDLKSAKDSLEMAQTPS